MELEKNKQSLNWGPEIADVFKKFYGNCGFDDGMSKVLMNQMEEALDTFKELNQDKIFNKRRIQNTYARGEELSLSIVERAWFIFDDDTPFFKEKPYFPGPKNGYWNNESEPE